MEPEFMAELDPDLPNEAIYRWCITARQDYPRTTRLIVYRFFSQTEAEKLAAELNREYATYYPTTEPQ